nr:hypothetical protein [Glycomyces harbinensis]
MQVSQVCVGIDTELIGQCSAKLGVDGQCLPRPPGTMQGEHQLPGEALVQRIFGCERTQSCNRPLVPAELNVNAEMLLEHGEPITVEPPGCSLNEAPRQARERGAAPFRDRFTHDGARRHELSRLEQVFGAALFRLAPQDVELIIRDRDPIAPPDGRNAIGSRAELTPQSADDTLDLLYRGVRRAVLPKSFDQTAHGYHPVCLIEQQRQEPRMVSATDDDRMADDRDLQRTEYPKLHDHHLNQANLHETTTRW